MAFLEVQNPAVLALEPVRAVIKNAYAEGDAVVKPDGEAVIGWLERHLPNPEIGLLLHGNFVDGFDGMVLAVQNDLDDPLSPDGMVGMLYAPRNPKTRREMTEAIVEWFESRGVKHFWAINQTEATDRAYTRLLKTDRCHGERIGSLLHYNIESEE